jgi:PhnB protein
METIKFDKDFLNKKIVVTVTFNASLNVLWNAFTNAATLDKWFAPKPYKAVTKSMDFREGGRWLYYMLSPEGQQIWSIADFTKIIPKKSYEALDAFTDENGVIDTHFPRINWKYTFSEEKGATTVVATLIFSREEDMKKILEMGFEEGFKMGLNQLSELLGK